MTLLKAGDKAPDFKLPGHDGKEYSLKNFAGKNVVLYFYPKDDTPGCTKEACSFRDNLPTFEGVNAAIVGVSADGKDSHNKFIDKYKLNFLLLSDPSKTMLKAYGVLKENGGIARTTYLIDGSGKIKHVFANVSVDGHTQEILKVLK